MAEEDGRACLACGTSLDDAAAARFPTYVWESIEPDDFILRRVNEAAITQGPGRAQDLIGRRASELYADDPRILDLLRHARSQRRSERRLIPGYRLRTTGEAVDVEVEIRPGLEALVVVTRLASTPARLGDGR